MMLIFQVQLLVLCTGHVIELS
ncbi:hypothetical protein Goarm_005771, partial [Gossypium armourianum]|nr:hypothetical protein [Gossypium armourianum]